MRTDLNILIKALRILSREIQSGDGVANAAIAEGADRLEEIQGKLEKCRAFFDYQEQRMKNPEKSMPKWESANLKMDKLYKEAKEACE